MIDTTHEAPERIWATMMDSECARSGTFVDLKEYPTKPNYDAIEYVRADLVQAAVAAKLREAAEDVREWGSLYSGSEDVTDEVANDILALIPQGAQAALDRALAGAKIDGMVEAANIVGRVKVDDRRMWTALDAAQDRIRDAIRKGRE